MSSGINLDSKADKRIAHLDGLRGVAAMLVVISHFSNAALADLDTSSIKIEIANFNILILGAFGSGAGQIGVMVFFTLSSFLMFYLYSEKKYTTGAGVSFVVARVARIFPLYYFVIFCSWLVDSFAPFDFLSIPADQIVGHLFFWDYTSVLWTIAPELIFYLFFLAIWAWNFPLASVLCPLGFYFLLCNYFPVGGRFYVAEFFLLGYVMYRYYCFSKNAGQIFKSASWCLPLLAVSFLLYLPAVRRDLTGISLHRSGWDDISYLCFIGLFFVICFESRWLRWMLSFPILRFFGNISFSVYLMHKLVINFLDYFGLIRPDALSFILLIALVVLVSSFTYFAIEYPLRVYIKKIYRVRGSRGKKIRTNET